VGQKVRLEEIGVNSNLKICEFLIWYSLGRAYDPVGREGSSELSE